MDSPLVLLWERVPEDERRAIEGLYRRWLGTDYVRLFSKNRHDWARDCLLAWMAARLVLPAPQSKEDHG